MAIAYYSLQEIPVFVPVSDIHKYDLLIERDNSIFRVEVKTSTQTQNSGNYTFSLRTFSGNKNNNKEVKRISTANCDIVFAYAMNGDMWEFPSKLLEGKATITANSKLYGKYKIFMK